MHGGPFAYHFCLCGFRTVCGIVPFWKTCLCIIIGTCFRLQVIFGDRKCSLENTGLGFFFSLIVSLIHQIEFWHLAVSGPGSVQCCSVSHCRCLFAIWVLDKKKKKKKWPVCKILSQMGILRNSWFSKALLNCAFKRQFWLYF